MDAKFEINLRAEKIRKKMSEGDYETALRIAEGIDWKRVHNANLLSMVATVYEKNEEYKEAKEILLLAFERAPIGKHLLYKLTELALKEGNIEEASGYYREFCGLTGDDSRQHLLRYMILKAMEAPLEQQIHSLERYTAEELDEKWLYELAELYHKAGDSVRCVATCDKLMLMFGLGKYVDKAMELKLQYAPLNKYQMDLVENRDKYEEKLRAVEQSYKGENGVSYEREDVEAAVKQAETEQNLAEEMSHITTEDSGETPEDPEKTRVMPELKRSVSASPAETADGQAERESEDGNGDEPAEEPAAYLNLAEFRRDSEVEPAEAVHIQMPAAEQEEGAYMQAPETEPEEAEEAPEQAFYEEPEGAIRVLEADPAAEESRRANDKPRRIRSARHLMVEARTPEKGLELAVRALKQIRRETGVKNPVAKITGSKLNSRGVLASAEKLAGKDLIIEEAADLTTESISELERLMAQDTTGMRIILIDNPAQMETLYAYNPAFADRFERVRFETSGQRPGQTASVENEKMLETEQPVQRSSKPEPEEELNIDEFAQYCCKYASEIDCSITGKSMLALYERIEIMEEDRIPLTRSSAEELIEEAADRAERPSFGGMVKGLFSAKYDKNGLLILKEEHFI